MFVLFYKNRHHDLPPRYEISQSQLTRDPLHVCAGIIPKLWKTAIDKTKARVRFFKQTPSFNWALGHSLVVRAEHPPVGCVANTGNDERQTDHDCRSRNVERLDRIG